MDSRLFTALRKAVVRCRGDQYADIGTMLEFDTRDFPKVIKPASLGPKESASRVHNLEVLMHLIDPKRDNALMNKTQDALLVCHTPPVAASAAA